MPAAPERREARSGSEDMTGEGEGEHERETESKKRKSLERNVRTKELGCMVRPQKFFLQKSENKSRTNFVKRRQKIETPMKDLNECKGERAHDTCT